MSIHFIGKPLSADQLVARDYFAWRLAANKPQEQTTENNPLFCGIDLGSKHDRTAVILLERVPREQQETHFYARHVKRMRVGVSYPDVVQYIVELDAKLEEQGHPAPTYIVDSTGLGQPVVAYLRQKIDPARVKAIFITGGQEMHIKQRNEITVPKNQLISMLILLLQTGRLHLPKTNDSRQLESELLEYELKQRIGGGTPEMGALRTGSFDDMVTALALAAYWGQKARKRSPATVRWI